MKTRRKSTPVKTPRGIANVAPDVALRDRCSVAESEMPDEGAAGILGRVLPPVLDDPLMFLPEVEKATRLSAVTIWRHEKAGKFPHRHRHGYYVAWFRSQIVAYLESLRADPGGFAPAPVKANDARRRKAA